MKKFPVAACIIVFILSFSALSYADEKEWDELTDRAIELYRTGHHKEAVTVARRALKSAEELFGPDDLKVVGSLDDLATYLHATGNNSEAERLYRRALAILDEKLPPDDPYLEIFLNYLYGFYNKIGKPEEAAKLKERARSIRSVRLGKTEDSGDKKR